MAAHLGTGVQMLSAGPQDALLVSSDADTSLFQDPFRPCSDFVEETRGTAPLRAFAFDRTNVFPLASVGDMLGDVCLEVRVPAAQTLVGTDLPLLPIVDPKPSDPGQWVRLFKRDTVRQPLSDNSVARVTMDRLDAQPTTGWCFEWGGVSADQNGTLEVLPFKSTNYWRFSDGLEWEVTTYPEGRIESWLTFNTWPDWVNTELPNHLVQPCRINITVSGVTKATFVQRVGRSAVVQVVPSGDVVTSNDVWRDRPALTLMRRARFVVGDLVVHDHERMWYDILDRLRVSEGVRRGLDAMLGKEASMGVAHILYLPFKFLSCRDGRPSQTFFPTILASRAAMRVEVTTESLAPMVPSTLSLPMPNTSWSAVLLTRHYTLTSAERSALLTRPPTIMYESAQDMDGLNYTAVGDGVVTRRDVTVDLSEVSWPVTFLAWAAYDPTSPAFTYLSAPLDAATLFFEGGVQRETGPGSLFEVMQPWYRAPRSRAARDVGMYSFALDSATRSPNGCATQFSSMQYPTLRVTLTSQAAAAPVHVKVWASTLNWLSFEGGTVSAMFAA